MIRYIAIALAIEYWLLATVTPGENDFLAAIQFSISNNRYSMASIMNFRLRAQFGGFLFGRGVTQKISAAYLRPGKIFQQVRTTQRRMKFDVEMEPAILAAVGRRLVQ